MSSERVALGTCVQSSSGSSGFNITVMLVYLSGLALVHDMCMEPLKKRQTRTVIVDAGSDEADCCSVLGCGRRVRRDPDGTGGPGTKLQRRTKRIMTQESTERCSFLPGACGTVDQR